MALERFIKVLILILFLGNGLTRHQNHAFYDIHHTIKRKIREKLSYSEPVDVIDACVENRHQTLSNLKILQGASVKKIFIPVITFKTHYNAALATGPHNRNLFRVLII